MQFNSHRWSIAMREWNIIIYDILGTLYHRWEFPFRWVRIGTVHSRLMARISTMFALGPRLVVTLDVASII